MSADNGHYILRTNVPGSSVGYEYRVAYAQAIDNIHSQKDWDHCEWRRTIFGNSKVHNNEYDALDEASRLENIVRTEYGVKMIRLNEEF